MSVEKIAEYLIGADVFRKHFQEEKRILEEHGESTNQLPQEVGVDAVKKIYEFRIRNYPRLAGTLFLRHTGLDLVRRGVDAVNKRAIRWTEKMVLKDQQ